ncbi:histidine kinase dimerization/phospho-acceptor domain-containing protein [Nocardioides marmoraquaticus]
MSTSPVPAPEVLRARGELDGPADVRVSAVLEVLAGASVVEVARRSSVEPALVHRWVRLFTDAGAARLANQPEPTLARQRDRFLAAFAHELRTPLAVAQGWSSVLADGDLPPDLAVATAAKLCAALDTVVERTREVEFLAAASLGRLRVTRRPVAARTLAPDDAGPTAGDPSVVAHTDPDLAGRIVRDLWHAALLAPTPQRRHVELREAHPWVEVRIVREGEPIDSRVLQALFDPFDLNDDDTGVTTGLYLARALSVALGGAIGLEQDAARAVFWLRIPRAHL